MTSHVDIINLNTTNVRNTKEKNSETDVRTRVHLLINLIERDAAKQNRKQSKDESFDKFKKHRML